VIPESVVGSLSAPTFETYGAALDLKFKSATYVGFQAQRLSSELAHKIGVFDFHDVHPPIVPSLIRESLDFDERSIGLTLNQLVGDQWSVGASYQFISSELNDRLVDADNSTAIQNGFTNANNTARSDLHHVATYLLFNHPSGFFARAEGNWFRQENLVHTYDTNGERVKAGLPDDEFPQFNVYIGWRFRRQLGDVTFGVLNLGGSDYHLNPLNGYPELAHERVYAGQVRLRF